MLVEIKSWIDGKVIYSVEADSLLKAMELAAQSGASLNRANLDGASLAGANLYRASLAGANLYRASLDGANLYRASLDGATRLQTGETWEEYLRDVVPALLQAGGKSLASFKEHWSCHSWENCPMAHAFDVHSENEAPILLRPRVQQFVQLFDAKLIPESVLETK